MILRGSARCQHESDSDSNRSDAANLGSSGVSATYESGTLGQPGLIATDPTNTALVVSADGGDHAGFHVTDFPELNVGGPYEEKTIMLWFQADDASTPVEQIRLS